MSRRDTAFGPTNGAVIIHLYHIIFRQVQQGHRLEKNPPFLLKMAAPKVQRNFCVVVFFCGGARIIGQSVRESPRGFTLTFVSSEFVAVFAQTVLLLPEERNCKGQ